MFGKKQEVEMMKLLAAGELERLISEIKASKKAILEVQTVEELYRGLYEDGKENEFAKEYLRRISETGKDA